MKHAAEPVPGQMTEGSKEEYQKFFNSAMKKFKINSPADLKSDEDKKKFYDYVDKNYKGEKSEELLKAVNGHSDWVNEKKIELAKEFKVSSMRQALEKVSSVGEDDDKDEKKDEDWTKKGPDAYDKKKKKDEDNEEPPPKNGKTLTGKKAAAIDLAPKMKT